MKLFQIIAIIFCLGIFLIPKDKFYSQISQETCCTSGSEMSCCKDEHSKDNHGKEQKSSSCHDDCCSTCTTCCSFVETPFSKNLQLEISYYKSSKNLYFRYSDPYISDRLKEIWQPPKIC